MQIKPKLLSSCLILLSAFAVLFSYRFESQLTNLPLFNVLIKQRKETRREAGLHKLNLYMVRDYRSFLEPVSKDEITKFQDYINYFDMIGFYVPDQAESFGMLGYTYARQNDIKKAIENYEIALKKNPHFFWYYYNLGLLLWAIGDQEHSSYLFQKSLSLDPRDTYKNIFTSRIYLDILKWGPHDEDVAQNLKLGYQRTFVFLRMLTSGVHAPDISSNVVAL